MEALECDMIVEEKEVMNARNLAISIKSQFCVTGRDTEVVAVQAGLKEREQPVQEEEVWPSDGLEDKDKGKISLDNWMDRTCLSKTYSTIGDGFGSQYRKNLSRRSFPTFKIGGNLGGGSSLNIIGSKKHKLRIKKGRLG